MHHTLTRDEYKEVIIVRHLLERDFDEGYDYLNEFLIDSQSWDRKLSGINHLLSIVLEQLDKKDVVIQKVVDFAYQLCDNMNFEIQEGDIQYLESLFSNDLGTKLSLEEELVIAQNRIYDSR